MPKPASLTTALVLTGLASASPGNADDRALPPPVSFADIPNVSITTYDVTGRDVASIRRSINALRPTDPNDGKRVDGLTSWSVRWQYRQGPDGKCSATLDDLTFSAVVQVPRLADAKVSAKVRAQFDRYLRALMAHEEGHVRYPWSRRNDIAAALNGATCAAANSAAKAVLKDIVQHEVAYDRDTRHGATTIPPFG